MDPFVVTVVDVLSFRVPSFFCVIKFRVFKRITPISSASIILKIISIHEQPIVHLFDMF